MRPDPYNPQSVVGHSFRFDGYNLELYGRTGSVVEVQRKPNACGAMGHVVIFSLNSQPGLYRTPWSIFRENADLLD